MSWINTANTAVATAAQGAKPKKNTGVLATILGGIFAPPQLPAVDTTPQKTGPDWSTIVMIFLLLLMVGGVAAFIIYTRKK